MLVAQVYYSFFNVADDRSGSVYIPAGTLQQQCKQQLQEAGLLQALPLLLNSAADLLQQHQGVQQRQQQGGQVEVASAQAAPAAPAAAAAANQEPHVSLSAAEVHAAHLLEISRNVMCMCDVFEVFEGPAGLAVVPTARLVAAAMQHVSWAQQQQPQVEVELCSGLIAAAGSAAWSLVTCFAYLVRGKHSDAGLVAHHHPPMQELFRVPWLLQCVVFVLTQHTLTPTTSSSSSSSTVCPQQQQQDGSIPKLLTELLQVLGWSDSALIHIASVTQQRPDSTVTWACQC
jgi:hypothetical protein